MHELSVVMSIIDIAEKEALAANASIVEEIELDIGALSGIELDALEFAWQQAVKNTKLENAIKRINHIEAKAKCTNCDTGFTIEHFYDSCPVCGGHFFGILQGKELRVKSLIVS